MQNVCTLDIIGVLKPVELIRGVVLISTANGEIPLGQYRAKRLERELLWMLVLIVVSLKNGHLYKKRYKITRLNESVSTNEMVSTGETPVERTE